MNITVIVDITVPRGLRRAEELRFINFSMPAETIEIITIKNVVIIEVEILKKYTKKYLLMAFRTIEIISRKMLIKKSLHTQSL